MKKRVLIITKNFPPLIGGMERLIWNVFRQLKSDYVCDVVGPRGCQESLSGVHTAIECRVAPVPIFLVSSLIKSFWVASRHHYSLCIAGSGVTAPMATLVGKLFKIPTIIFIHGLDIVVDNRLYQQVFVPAIKRSDIVIANSHNTATLAEAKGISPEKIEVLFPGVGIPQTSLINPEFRQQYNLENKQILLSVGRLIPRKGLAEFLKFSFPTITKECPNVVFLIIGSEAQNALKKDGQVLRDIKTIIQENHLTNHVLLLGRVDDATLETAYQEADLFIFPLREVKGDVEGFGMVAVEAAAYGLPTIAFAVGGVTDAVAHEKSGFLVAPNEYDEFTKVIINYLKNNTTGVTPAACQHHAKQFSWDNFGEKLCKICKRTTTSNVG